MLFNVLPGADMSLSATEFLMVFIGWLLMILVIARCLGINDLTDGE